MAYELKTKINDSSVSGFLDKIEDEKKRKDCYVIIGIMQEISGLEPKMWGTSIIGFGSYHYKYASGHEGDMCLIGFSPRKANITLYLAPYYALQDPVIQQLGKYKTGKGCIYINKMEDINIDALKTLIKNAVVYLKKLYPQKA